MLVSHERKAGTDAGHQVDGHLIRSPPRKRGSRAAVGGSGSPLSRGRAEGRGGAQSGPPFQLLQLKPRYDVVLSNTPPDDFSFRATSAYSDSIWRRSLSPVRASGIDTMRRPLR